MTQRTTERPFRASVQKRATVQGHTFYARLHLRDGSRPAIRLPNATSESAARAEADRLQAKAWAEGWVKEPPTAPGETVARWFGRYFAHREVKGLRGIKQERSVGRPRSRKGLDRSGERGIRTRQEQAFSASDPAVKPVSIPPGLPAFPPSALPVDTNVDDNAVEADARARHLLVAIAALLEQARHEDAAQLARRLTALLEQLATVGAALALLTAGLAATGVDHPRKAQDPYVSSGLHGLSLSLTTTSRERSFRPFDSFGRAKTGHRTPEGSPEGSPRSFGAQAPGRGGHR